MTGISAENVMIRPGCTGDLPLLADIEIDAFATLADALGVARDAHPLSLEVLGRSLQESLLFIAVDDADRPIGFLAGAEIERTLYVIELDVVTEWQRQGLGRRLMAKAIETARARKLAGVTLTTDRDVTFNAPFYHSLGFELLAFESMPAFMQKKLDEEIVNGMDPERRVAMALWLDRSSRHEDGARRPRQPGQSNVPLRISRATEK
ncbi:GNAT family N-acetyltransferase [Rhizobium sp. Root1220]|uniref:GNAT family N-acetyltransferase n=1 Tax=Rhizobium sp. Root1220 TaxID=1736432 RepID=UPI001FCD8E7F|nr:GNAT family N-acetyltransferase [Rhizobium sp. Root1220]